MTLAADTIPDVTTASFRQEVIAESMKQPVLVDFWAPWCGPCKQLAPLLEKAVATTRGKVKLVKMNIDEHPQVAGQLGIQSIPAVIAFTRGQPVDGFMGALPEGQIKGFLERLVGPVEEDGALILEEASRLEQDGDPAGAAELYAGLLQNRPDDWKALSGLARTFIALGETEQARALLDSVPEGQRDDPALASVRKALELAEQASQISDTAELEQRIAANPRDYQARFDLALALNGKGRREEAAEQLLGIISLDRNWQEDGARKQLVQFFEVWGPMDEATQAARRRLSSLLFA